MIGFDYAMVGNMRSNKNRQNPAVERFKRFLAAAEARVSVETPHLADACDQIEHAQDYLISLIETEIRRLNYTSWDDANEKSELLSGLMFVCSVLDDARAPLEKYELLPVSWTPR